MSLRKRAGAFGFQFSVFGFQFSGASFVLIRRRGVPGRFGRSATESDEPKRLVIRQFLPEFVDVSVTVGEIWCGAPGWGCLAVRAGGYAIRVCLMSGSFATSVQYEA